MHMWRTRGVSPVIFSYVVPIPLSYSKNILKYFSFLRGRGVATGTMRNRNHFALGLCKRTVDWEIARIVAKALMYCSKHICAPARRVCGSAESREDFRPVLVQSLLAATECGSCSQGCGGIRAFLTSRIRRIHGSVKASASPT